MTTLPRIPQSTIEEVSRRADIDALLARAGCEMQSNRMYCCPMHDDGTASLKVYPADGAKAPRFKCFGCGAGGDAIELAQRLGGVSFPEAVRSVAEASGVTGLDGLEPPQPGQRDDPDQRAGAYERGGSAPAPLGSDALPILSAAQAFFVGALGSAGAGAAEARRYLASRGIGPAVANLYGVGFAPPSWSALTDELERLGADEDSVVAAGLARLRKTRRSSRPSPGARSSSGPRRSYDLFRGRLTFPLLVVDPGDDAVGDPLVSGDAPGDDRTPEGGHVSAGGRPGAVVGFGARLVPELGAGSHADAPKYLNSPDSDHFSKGELLFGLPQAACALEQEEQVVALVEGYFDVLALAEAGVVAVAPCGTAFSAEQAARLRGCGARRALVLFDDDDAGRAATGPAVEKLLVAGLLPIVGSLGVAQREAQAVAEEADAEGAGGGEDASGVAMSSVAAGGVLAADAAAADAAEVLVQSGPEELRRRVEASSQPVTEYLFKSGVGGRSAPPISNRRFQPIRLGGADAALEQALRAAETIALSPEPLVRGALAREAGGALGVPPESILDHARHVRAQRGTDRSA